MMSAPQDHTTPSLWAKLDRFEELFAVLIADHMERQIEFRWPLSLLPSGSKIGDMLFVKLNTKENEEEEKYNRMRRLLEELIN